MENNTISRDIRYAFDLMGRTMSRGLDSKTSSGEESGEGLHDCKREPSYPQYKQHGLNRNSWG